ncbi:MAG: hypothetical protein CL471_08740 [Acidobacteria bacterium]|nr:hypothetical protein [Acidobacteriota bacterium]
MTRNDDVWPTRMTVKTVAVAARQPEVGERFAAALRSAEHRPVTLVSTESLVARLGDDRNSIDLLILDLRLEPRGLALVEKIRAVATEQARLPILVFSGSVASTDEVRRLSTLGIAGYVNEHCAAQQILPALAPHLFPDSFNRRSSPRVTLGIPIAYRVGESLNSATTLGLSKGGVAIRTMTPPDLFSQVEVRFRLPGVKREIEAAARVTWTDARVGMGLQFERIDATDQAAVDDFVDQHLDSSDPSAP